MLKAIESSECVGDSEKARLGNVPFEGELETLVDSHIVSRHRLAYIYPPLLKGHKVNLNPTVS